MEGFRLSGCFFNGCVAIGRGDQAPLRRSRNITGGVSCGEQNRGAVGRAELVLAHVACLQGKKKGGAFSARHRVFVALRGRPGRTGRAGPAGAAAPGRGGTRRFVRCGSPGRVWSGLCQADLRSTAKGSGESALISFAVGWVIFTSIITEAAGRSVSQSTAL